METVPQHSRRDLGNTLQPAEGLQPLALHEHPEADEAILGEDGTQGEDLAAVAPVQGANGGQVAQFQGLGLAIGSYLGVRAGLGGPVKKTPSDIPPLFRPTPPLPDTYSPQSVKWLQTYRPGDDVVRQVMAQP